MYFLLEISDKYIVLFGIIVVVILLVTAVILFAFSKKNKVKPIDENDRFEELSEPKFKKVEELTDEQKKARAELERVFNKMNEDLQKESETVVDNFEREQEENAIISYQELIKQVKGVKEEVDETPVIKEPSLSKIISTKEPGLNLEHDITFDENAIYNDDIVEKQGEKETYLSALENLKVATPISENVERKPYSGTKTKFNSSEIISPIFGRQEPIVKEEKFDVDETYSSLNRENEHKQNEEFLNTLKEFRNNL